MSSAARPWKRTSLLFVMMPGATALGSDAVHGPGAGLDSLEVPFVLFDAEQKVRRTGAARISELPRAAETVIALSERDIGWVTVPLPALSGARLRQALPHLVEEHLLSDPSEYHVAIDAANAGIGDGLDRLGLIARERFASIVRKFDDANHARIRVVALSDALRKVQGPIDHPCNVTLVGRVSGPPSDPLADSLYEWVMTTSTTTLSVACLEEDLADAIAATDQAHRTASIDDGRSDPSAAEIGFWRVVEVSGVESIAPFPFANAKAIRFVDLARAAATVVLDFCQFEFSRGSFRASRSGWLRWRAAAALALASIVVAVIGANVEWWQLASQRDLLASREEAILRSVAPETTVILDAPLQFERAVNAGRAGVANLAPDDFVPLCADLSRALAGYDRAGIAGLEFAGHRLIVRFRAEAPIPADFPGRLEAVGLEGHPEDLAWNIGRRK